MLEYLKFQYKLNKLFREKDKTRKLYAKSIEELRSKTASRDEFESLYAEERSMMVLAEHEIENLTTTYFIRVAQRKFIEIPVWNDENAWISSSLDPNRRVLSNAAISELRSKIMTYRKERNEQLVPLISALTGLAGAVIGLIALFMS